jgi:hypothetical protein
VRSLPNNARTLRTNSGAGFFRAMFQLAAANSPGSA